MTKRRKSSAVEIKLSAAQRQELESWRHSRTLPSGLSRRARIVLLAADGLQNLEISEKVGLSRISVGKWRRRFAENGLSGLYDQLKPGRPRSLSDEKVAELINTTLQRKPKGGTHWSTRQLAGQCGVCKSTVQRVWSAFGLQPHRSKGFTLSNDPFFVEKVRNIVGLYLNPPCNALVLCVDEKSQCQALERTQPVLPLGLGYLEGVTHEYLRHGTLTLFAALDIATGEVISQCSARHRHQEFLRFLKRIDDQVPEELDIHLIMDNYCTHRQKKVQTWLARRPRYQVHFTPTYSSWLNQVERWFGLITQKAIRRGSFTSTRQLSQKIDTFVRNYNKHSRPFTWTATADSILNKLARLCNVINGTEH